MDTLHTHRRIVTVWAAAGREFWPHSTGREPKRTTATTTWCRQDPQEGNLCTEEAHSEADRQVGGGSRSEAQGPVHQGNNQGDGHPQETVRKYLETDSPPMNRPRVMSKAS